MRVHFLLAVVVLVLVAPLRCSLPAAASSAAFFTYLPMAWFACHTCIVPMCAAASLMLWPIKRFISSRDCLVPLVALVLSSLKACGQSRRTATELGLLLQRVGGAARATRKPSALCNQDARGVGARNAAQACREGADLRVTPSRAASRIRHAPHHEQGVQHSNTSMHRSKVAQAQG